jgi:hypothetical protein
MIFMSIALERGFDAMANAQTLTSQVLQGTIGNASLISISNMFQGLDSHGFPSLEHGRNLHNYTTCTLTSKHSNMA